MRVGAKGIGSSRFPDGRISGWLSSFVAVVAMAGPEKFLGWGERMRQPACNRPMPAFCRYLLSSRSKAAMYLMPRHRSFTSRPLHPFRTTCRLWRRVFATDQWVEMAGATKTTACDCPCIPMIFRIPVAVIALAYYRCRPVADLCAHPRRYGYRTARPRHW